MKIWNTIVSAVYIAAGIVLSFVFLLMSAGPHFSERLFDSMLDNKAPLFFTGTFIIILGIVWIIYWFNNRLHTQSVSFDNPDGTIKVSLKAVEDYVSSMLSAQIDSIRSIRVKAHLSSKGIGTVINLRLYAGLNIPEVCTRIQEMTKNYLQDAVGLDRISNIEVFVRSIKGGGELLQEPSSGKEE